MEFSDDPFQSRSPDEFSFKKRDLTMNRAVSDFLTTTRAEEDEFSVNEESSIPTVVNLFTRNMVFEYSENIETYLSEEDDHRETIHNSYIHKFSYNFSSDEFLSELTLMTVQNIESATPTNRWKLQDVALNFLIKKSEHLYIWNAENKILNAECAVQIILRSQTELVHDDFSETKEILKRLELVSNIQNTLKIHCSSWYQEDEFLVIILVHEPIHFTLQDYFNFRLKQEDFLESEILQIVGEIQNGFEDYLEHGIWIQDLSLENIFISKDDYSIRLNGFDLELPIIGEEGIREKVKWMKSQMDTRKSRSDQFVRSISTLAFQLVTMNKDPGFLVNKIEKDIVFKRKYPILLYLLSLRGNNKDFRESLTSMYTRNCKRNYKSLGELGEHNLNKSKEVFYFELIKEKERGYKYLKNSKASFEILKKARLALQVRESKTKKEYQQYLICVNKSLTHCMELEDLKELFEIKRQVDDVVKSNEKFNKVKIYYPRDYAEYIFLMGKIQQKVLKNVRRAKKINEEGIIYCRHAQIKDFQYCCALKCLIKICQELDDNNEVLKYCEYLKEFYSEKEGLYLEKAKLYSHMANFLTKKGDYGRAVRLYISAFNMYKKRVITKREVFIEVLENIIEACENLKDDDVAIKYLRECETLKKEEYGEVSREYANVLKRMSEIHMRNQAYPLALEHYLNYLTLLEKLDGFASEKYAESLLFLSEIYLGMGSYDKALEMYDEYVSLSSEWNEVQGLKSFMLMDKIANVLFKKEDFQASIEVQFLALLMKERIFGKISKYYFVSLNNIGDTYFACREYEKALEYHSKCLNVVKCDTKNAKNSDCVQVLLNIAYDYERMGKYGKAIEYLYQSIQLNSTRGSLPIESIVEEYEALDTLKKKRLITLNFNEITIQTNMSFK